MVCEKMGGWQIFFLEQNYFIATRDILFDAAPMSRHGLQINHTKPRSLTSPDDGGSAFVQYDQLLGWIGLP